MKLIILINTLTFLYYLAKLLHSPEKLHVRPRNLCDGNNMRSEEKLHFSAFVSKCKVSQKNAIFLQENANALRANTIVSRGNAIQFFVSECDSFVREHKCFAYECNIFCEPTQISLLKLNNFEENAKTVNICFSSHHHVSLRTLWKLTKKLQQKTSHNKQDIQYAAVTFWKLCSPNLCVLQNENTKLTLLLPKSKI